MRRIIDRKSTRLNSSHGSISYAVFCLKKKKNTRPVPVQLLAIALAHTALTPPLFSGNDVSRSGAPDYGLHSEAALSFFFFFFNDTATTEIYTLSLHDALPISLPRRRPPWPPRP